MEFFPASFQKLYVARSVDGVSELCILPFGQVVLFGSPGLLLLYHSNRPLELLRHWRQAEKQIYFSTIVHLSGMLLERTDLEKKVKWWLHHRQQMRVVIFVYLEPTKATQLCYYWLCNCSKPSFYG